MCVTIFFLFFHFMLFDQSNIETKSKSYWRIKDLIGGREEKLHESVCETRLPPCGNVCNVIMVLMVVFLSVIGFISMSSFSWCCMCRWQSHGGVSTTCLFLIFFFFYFYIFSCVSGRSLLFLSLLFKLEQQFFFHSLSTVVPFSFFFLIFNNLTKQ